MHIGVVELSSQRLQREVGDLVDGHRQAPLRCSIAVVDDPIPDVIQIVGVSS